MVFSTQPLTRRLAGGALILVLMCLLAACGGTNTDAKNGNSGGSTSANPVKQMVPMTMTPAATASVGVTGTASVTANLTKTYTGNGFTIKYPKGWKETASSAAVAFTDPTGNYNLTIGFTPNPNGVKTADQLADGGIVGAKTNLTSVQMVNLPQTTTVGGQTWSQRSITGTSALGGQSTAIEAVVLADNHPTHTAATKGYVLVYVASKGGFEQANAEYFQPMLQSFKYAA